MQRWGQKRQLDPVCNQLRCCVCWQVTGIRQVIPTNKSQGQVLARMHADYNRGGVVDFSHPGKPDLIKRTKKGLDFCHGRAVVVFDGTVDCVGKCCSVFNRAVCSLPCIGCHLQLSAWLSVFRRKGSLYLVHAIANADNPAPVPC